ncbi:MAG: bifunctional (p)ppGpp synthetase/guanosine-3',5'-bis(diphosphate) 3'-pyrophosphohydrolase [Bacteroidales bacterium]|nr:bifunctional (p)ppGpp synthetase/guanosine-3',5'-bis(diphosphate) 3'-pyrophosphohydrolase [Bacteroidales bacterium]
MSGTLKKEYDSLMELARGRCRDKQEMDMVRKAYQVASEAHKGVLLHNGEPFVLHSVEVAKIVVANVGLGYKSICAALLVDVVEQTDYTVEHVRSMFGDKIAELVEGLANINNILDTESVVNPSGVYSEDVQAENLKRMLLNMGNDVRVVLIKLADRLECMRNLDDMPESKREKVLTETMGIFIPLAHRLGLYTIKSELENIWLRYVHPDEYNEIVRRTDTGLANRIKELDDFIEPIANALLEKGFRFAVKKRIKTPYSIWHKMKTKHVPFEQIYDLYAVRIIFDPETDDIVKERDKAFVIYSTVTSLYKGKDSRFRDWIRHPKKNGYEALHMTVMSQSGIWVEVQVRSRRMDDIAEKGIAAHWAYKNEGYLSEADTQMDRWLAKVQEILNSDSIDALELLDLLQDNFSNSEIVVFTPKGEQRSIPKGSTALDFAYKIHTKVGNHAIAAKVNQKLVPLSKTLRSGDQVEIITAVNAQPKLEWLTFLNTRSAKRKMMEWIREHAPKDVEQAEILLNSGAEEEPAELPIKIMLQGHDRPGLAEEIENALKKIDGIENVVISNI